MRIVLANQGTYLAYIRTSFAVVALATKFKSLVVILVGMLLITVGVYQYYTIDLDLENQVHRLSNKEIFIADPLPENSFLISASKIKL